MTDMPKAGFLCAGKTPLALSDSVYCAYKIMDILRENGFSSGACHTEITEPYDRDTVVRAERTLVHMCSVCELVITVGCDGFAVSDIMPDITGSVCRSADPFFSQVLSGAKDVLNGNGTPFITGLSRGTSGLCGDALVINLPSDCRYSCALVSALLPAIGFAVYGLSGKSARNCAEFRNFLNNSLDFHEVFKKLCIINL